MSRSGRTAKVRPSLVKGHSSDVAPRVLLFTFVPMPECPQQGLTVLFISPSATQGPLRKIKVQYGKRPHWPSEHSQPFKQDGQNDKGWWGACGEREAI